MLHELVQTAVRRDPTAVAVSTAHERWTYAHLDATANRQAHALVELGVQPGDRVAVWLEKSPRAVAALQAVLRLGAAYVPIDPLSPATRAARIVRDCSAAAVVCDPDRAEQLDDLGLPPAPYLGAATPGGMPWTAVDACSAAPLPPVAADHDALAYVLYTSGSTGDPKGVCISHRAALAFVEWAATELGARPDDCFANHAPFHFDLSVLDLYAAFAAGARVHLVPSAMAYAPERLVALLVEEAITVWYSVPSALVLMMREGGLLGVPLDRLALRALLFAGEVFPVQHLAPLRRCWPHVRFLNLYGPTETNVCTFHEVAPEDPVVRPVPLGAGCCGDEVWAEHADGHVCAPGEEGELVVDGPTVMLGYWGRAPVNLSPYRTGDIVRVRDDASFDYVGRRDGMVKVRGHRVELGEIEVALGRHPAISDAAVAVAGSGLEARLVAFVVAAPGIDAPSILEMKRHCAQHLPQSMIVDAVEALGQLPRTPNGKIDRRLLAEWAPAGTPLAPSAP